MALSSTHRISTAHMSSNRNIISILVTRNSNVTGIQEYLCNNKQRNINSDPCKRNTEIINACILVNLCNSDVWIWYNCVQSIHIAMIQISEMMVSSEIVYPCISETWIKNNSVMCNSICVTVIHVHEIMVFSITGIYMKYNIYYTRIFV